MRSIFNVSEYQTNSFILRPVMREDAADLIDCYSTRATSNRSNADNCTSDFYFESLNDLDNYIAEWIDAYNDKRFVRFAVIAKSDSKAVGTLEIFGGDIGVLRIDLEPAYDLTDYTEELIKLCAAELIGDAGVRSLKVKTANTPDRVPILTKYGFTPDNEFRPESAYYSRTVTDNFNPDAGIAYCGIACCLCERNTSCAGCKKGGHIKQEWCKCSKCAESKGLGGCWECETYPCADPMSAKPRSRAFAKYILEHGETALINALGINEKRGILYHYKDSLTGDYDRLGENEILDLLSRWSE